MSPRTGRPPSENPKIERITVRLNERQQKALEQCAECFGTSKADIICRGLSLMEIEKENPKARQLFDAIEILFEILERQEKFSAEVFNENIDKSLQQIDLNYGEFVKSIEK